MTYSVQISSRGAITIPKAIREDLGTSNILIIKKGNTYSFRPITKISKLGKSIKTTKKLNDKAIQKLKQEAFLRPKNIY